MEHSDADLTYLLPRHLYYHAVHVLRAALPPPATDSQEDLVRRDHAAITQVASLLPANGEEVMLAAQYVAANAQALDCLRLLRQHRADMAFGLKCMAQSASMMRQARGARALLLKVQSQRQKREANDAARDSAALIEHCATGLMNDALSINTARTDPVDQGLASYPAEAASRSAERSASTPPRGETRDAPPAPDPLAARQPDQPRGQVLSYPRRTRLEHPALSGGQPHWPNGPETRHAHAFAAALAAPNRQPTEDAACGTTHFSGPRAEDCTRRSETCRWQSRHEPDPLPPVQEPVCKASFERPVHRSGDPAGAHRV